MDKRVKERTVMNTVCAQPIYMKAVGNHEKKPAATPVDLMKQLDLTDRGPANPKDIAERRVRHQIHFLDEEYYVFIDSPSYKGNANIFPFQLNQKTFYKVDQHKPAVEQNDTVVLPLPEITKGSGSKEFSPPWPAALERISNVFTQGFNNVCQVIDCNAPGKFIYPGCCHHFANYLAFGMTLQKFIDFNGWHDTLPFASVLDFSQETLRWGDVVQLFEHGKIVHSMFHVGDGIYMNKHGFNEIYFQSLPACKVTYPSDFARIVRVSPEYHSEKVEFRQTY